MMLIKRFIRRFKRLFRYLTVIWRTEDWDYSFTLELFRMKLEDMAEFYEEKVNVYSANASYKALRIRRILRLFEWVYSEKYLDEARAELVRKWGEGFDDFIERNVVEHENGGRSWSMTPAYQTWDNADEVLKHYDYVSKKYEEKQKKAHKLLWKLVEENIQEWWD